MRSTTFNGSILTIDSVEGQKFDCLTCRGSLVSEPLFVIDPYCDGRMGQRFGHNDRQFGVKELDLAFHLAFEMPKKNVNQFHNDHHTFAIIHTFTAKKQLHSRILAYKVDGQWRLITIFKA